MADVEEPEAALPEAAVPEAPAVANAAAIASEVSQRKLPSFYSQRRVHSPGPEHRLIPNT